MDVVADGRAIGSGIIFSEDGEFGRIFPSSRENTGDEMLFGIVVLAAFFGGAGGIEVAQRDELQAVGDVEGV